MSDRTLGVIAFALLTAVSSKAQSASAQSAHPLQSAEAYEVYSVVIPQVQSIQQTKFLVATDTIAYSDTKTRFPIDPEKLVTREEFEERLRASKGTTEWNKIWKGQPCVLAPEAERDAYLSAMRDYRWKNEISVILEPKFNLPKPFELVRVRDLSGDKKSELVERKGAYGIYQLSAVGFSSDMTTAIVYIGFDCPMSGRWALHVLRKTDGKWQQVAVGCSWLS
jgi:hypothetical protein